MPTNQSYKLSQLAQEHLRTIKSYTLENHSESQWQSYKETLISGLQLLADNPKLGKSCDDIYPEGLYFPVAIHTVYFTIEEDGILIAAVLGQSQLPERHLK